MSQGTGVKSASATGSTKQTSRTEPTPGEIRQRAYEIYVSRHGAPGDEVGDWLQAERELRLKQS
jgi:hypothetical protein